MNRATWLFLAGCGASAGIPVAAPAPTASNLETAPHGDDAGEADRVEAAPSVEAAPLASAPTPAPTPAPPPIASLFLPRQAACSTDADCGMTMLALVDEAYECCGWCTPTAGTKAWVQSVQKKCDAKIHRGFVPRCAPWDCAAPPPAKCESGTCVVGARP